MSCVYRTYHDGGDNLLGRMKGRTVNELIALIDAYRDKHGQPSEASISRAIDAAPQTVNSWRNRGIKKMPDKETLAKLARLLHVDEQVVVLAAARDAGYLRPRGDEGDQQAPPIAK